MKTNFTHLAAATTEPTRTRKEISVAFPRNTQRVFFKLPLALQTWTLARYPRLTLMLSPPCSDADLPSPPQDTLTLWPCVTTGYPHQIWAAMPCSDTCHIFRPISRDNIFIFFAHLLTLPETDFFFQFACCRSWLMPETENFHFSVSNTTTVNKNSLSLSIIIINTLAGEQTLPLHHPHGCFQWKVNLWVVMTHYKAAGSS